MRLPSEKSKAQAMLSTLEVLPNSSFAHASFDKFSGEHCVIFRMAAAAIAVLQGGCATGCTDKAHAVLLKSCLQITPVLNLATLSGGSADDAIA